MHRCATLLLAAVAFGAVAEDGKDHPALARYPGAEIKGYNHKDYEEAALPLSAPVTRGSRVVADKSIALEGKVTYIHYEAPKSASALQVFRNYQSALRRSGFQDLFVCDRPCGDAHLSAWKDLLKSRDLYLNGGNEDLFYVAAQRENVYVGLIVNTMTQVPHVWQFVIEKTALDDQKIAVTGNGLIAQGLARDGRVDVYGFLFDTGQSQLKAGSADTLKELAQVLKDNPKLAVDVIGHTDDVGAADANQSLSLARAQAVAAALTSEHGIDPGRLAAQGRGAMQPVASNKTEYGKAKNRRVEIALRGAAPAAAVVQGPAGTAPAAEPAASTPDAQAAKPGKLEKAAKKLKELIGR